MSKAGDVVAGVELAWLKDAHDKFANAEAEPDDPACADPGKGLAWLVVIQVLLYYLCTSIISTVTYLGLFAFIYVKWVYPMSNAVDVENIEESVEEDDKEPEWLLDQFFSFIQQNKTEDSPSHSPSHSAEIEHKVPDVEENDDNEEPGWLVDQFLSYVQKYSKGVADVSEEAADIRCISKDQTQQKEDSKENRTNDQSPENLLSESQMTVSEVSKVTCSVTNISNTVSDGKAEDDDDNDFEMIDSDDLN